MIRQESESTTYAWTAGPCPQPPRVAAHPPPVPRRPHRRPDMRISAGVTDLEWSGCVGFEGQAGVGEESVEQLGAVLMLLSRFLTIVWRWSTPFTARCQRRLKTGSGTK